MVSGENMFKNVNKVMYVYGLCMFFFLVMMVLDFKTIDLLFCLSMNAVTANYVILKNFVY